MARRSLKKMFFLLCALASPLGGLCGCAAEERPEPTPPPHAEETEPQEPQITETEDAGVKNELTMTIDGQKVSVVWEANEAVEALRELAAEAPITIEMSMYGGFEQVGSIGASLPRSDAQTKTSAGDIVLYSGDQLVVFYGSNSWAYTRLGHVADRNAEELAALLGNGNVTVTLCLEEVR